METKKVFIDVKKLLNQTDNGRGIYEMIVPDLQRDGDSRYKNALNPFYGDTEPGLSVFKDEKGIWRHFDHGDSSYSGNAIDIAGLHYKLDPKAQFAEILRRIAEDLKIEPELLAKEEDFIPEWWLDEKGMETAYGYFSNYGITKDVLKRFGVRGVRKYPSVDEHGKMQWRCVSKDKIIIAYEEVNHTKLYIPGAEKKFKFQFVGLKPKDFIFGKGQILTNLRWTKNTDRGPLIITGGEKDVLTITSMGYDAITLNSETASLPSHVQDFLTLYDKVVVLYDIDETGKKQASKLAAEHNFSVCTLPQELLQKGGKDVSDYIKLGMSKDDLRSLIENSSIPDLPAAQHTEAGKPAISIQQPDSGDTPLLPDEVYTLLPETLKRICEKFEDRREKDICLLSCITVLSTCFPKVKGIYDNKRIGCNFNLFITAPASAGKGVMTWSRHLGVTIDKYLNHRFKIALKEYERKLKEYDPASDEERPEPPKEPMFFIPANSSTSSIYECLDANQNFGIILDTEGDTLSSNMKNEWADFSSLIRKAFHHEFADMKRRTGNEYRRIEKPHLSVLLTGTRNQVTRLIDSVENGLFSRFGFYDVELDLPWEDKFGNLESDMEEFFRSIGGNIFAYWKFAEDTDEILCVIDDDQRETVFKFFSEKLHWLHTRYGENIVANVRRTCIIYYRIAMILAALRYFERVTLKTKSITTILDINKEESMCALLIVDTLLRHLEFVYTRIQMTGATSKLNGKQRLLFDALPDEFTWQEFLSAAESAGITNAAAQKYRRDFLEAKLLKSPEHNRYRKS
jgi:hypothetical protein